MYEAGALDKGKGLVIPEVVVKREREKGYQITRSDRFLTKTRYFTDSGIIGSRKFVIEHFEKFKDYLKIKNDRKPKLIKGLDGIYSMRRLGIDKPMCDLANYYHILSQIMNYWTYGRTLYAI